MMKAPRYASGAVTPALETMNGIVNMPAMAGAIAVTPCMSTPGSPIAPALSSVSATVCWDGSEAVCCEMGSAIDLLLAGRLGR